jgi:hypothetical protein
MSAPATNADSVARLRWDIASTKMLVWVVSIGRDAELAPETHIYFFDRYQRLANYHRRRGHETRARQLQAKADKHFQQGGGDGPPYAAAMGMPRPRRWVVTDAVSRHHLKGPDDAA